MAIIYIMPIIDIKTIYNNYSYFTNCLFRLAGICWLSSCIRVNSWALGWSRDMNGWGGVDGTV